MTDQPVPADTLTGKSESPAVLGDGMSFCATPMCNGSNGWSLTDYEGEPAWEMHCGCGWLNEVVPVSHLEGPTDDDA